MNGVAVLAPDEELTWQEALMPSAHAGVSGEIEAITAAEMYRGLERARGRDMDIGIAACAVAQGARLWTLNPDDFRDLPAVELYSL